jgi:putative acetyltransferase
VVEQSAGIRQLRHEVPDIVMNIRSYASKDAEPLSRLYVRSVRQTGGRFYTPEQVETWAALAPSPERLDELAGDGRLRLVAVDDLDQPVAFTDLEPNGHIHFLYGDPAWKGRGAAMAIYQAMEQAARERRIGRLYAEASEAALSFFQRNGFAVLARRDFEVQGVPIHNYAVEKMLTVG